MFQIIFLTVAVSARLVTSEATTETQILIPKPHITQKPSHEVLFSSEKVTLECVTGAKTDVQYEWYKDSTLMEPPSDQAIITVKNSGRYECKVKQGAMESEKSDFKMLHLQAIPTPELTLEPALAGFYPTEKVTLKCEIEGSSDDWSYIWYKNKESITESKSPLEITVASTDDSREYTCQGLFKDRVTTVMSSSVTLQVKEIPTPKLTLEPALAGFYPTEKVTLKCEIEGSSDEWSYILYKNKKRITESKSPLEMTVASTDDSREYTCQGFIKNRVTTGMSTAVTLQVKETPIPKMTINPKWTEFFPNEKITLTCGFDGSLDGWSFEWLKNDITIETSSSLTMAVQPSDSARYRCQGKLRSVVSQQSDEYQINVKDQWPKPILTRKPNFQVFYKGETLTFTCDVQVKSSEWEYLFFRDSVQIKADTSNSFSISSVSDSGKYSCSVKRRTLTSPVQSDVHSVTLKEIPTVHVKSEWNDAFPDETVSLKCVISDLSEDWSFMWFRDNHIVLSGPDKNMYKNTLSLSIKTSHTQIQEHKYSCQAQLKGRNVKSARSEKHLLKIYGSRPTIGLTQEPQYPEIIIFTGEQVKLICIIQEQTLNWVYKWERGESAKYADGETYTIQSAKLSDNGLYTCHIIRNGVKFSKSKNITIIEPPIPNLSIESQWKTFYPTEKITLKCSINHNPNNWRYEWYRNLTKISEEKNTLLLNSAEISHSGFYKCRAKHRQRSPVTTNETKALNIYIFDDTNPKPDIKIHPYFDFFYTDEQIHLVCNMPGDGWKYYWYKDHRRTESKNYTNSVSPHHTGVYRCEAKRGAFSIHNELEVKVQAHSPTVLTLVTELSDIIAGNILTLKCEVSDGMEWNYTWSENGQELNESLNILKVKSTEDTIKNEFKCRGKRTVRPLYSSWSEGFVANNLVFKRKILLAISGFFICCMVILIIGGIVLKITRKPVKKEPTHENLFISMADSKNQVTTPLMEYIENKPIMNESEENEDVNRDRISVTHVDGVIKGEDSPSAEANGLTSFKGN